MSAGWHAAFEKYDVLSVRDRRAVVDKAIQEVHALAAGSPAQSRGERASSLPTDDASLGAVELPTSYGHPAGKVSSLKNLVGDRNKPVLLAADLEGVQSSADTLAHSTGAPAEQQRVAQVSQRNRGIKLMTAAGSSSAARLSSVADLAAASAEPRHEHSPAAKQPRVHAGGSQRAAVHQSHMRTQHLGAPTLSRAPSTAEQAYSMGAPAVLVGEDEEFSVGSGEPPYHAWYHLYICLLIHHVRIAKEYGSGICSTLCLFWQVAVQGMIFIVYVQIHKEVLQSLHPQMH